MHEEAVFVCIPSYMIHYIREDYYDALQVTSNNPQAAALLLVAQELVSLRLLIQDVFVDSELRHEHGAEPIPREGEVEQGPDGRIRSIGDDRFEHVEGDA